MKIFAKEILKEIRLKKGFSITRLAEEAGISKQMMGQVERRENGISPEKSQAVLKVLKMEFDDVFELVEKGE